ncbi:iron-containing alcohol dehydrogenase [Haliangium sp.]|uniref:iron-containing alcohol dehydrogenase n=1 Tax=Haliangium sp. TaxID=2663208 RepID=UPI003D143D23
MSIQQFNYPTTILYGPGATRELAQRLAQRAGGEDDRRVLLVTDPGLVDAGLAEAVSDNLSEAGLTVTVHSEVHGNPVEADVVSGVERWRDSGSRAIVALGGGSPMDAAKAIAVLATHDGPLSRFDDAQGGDRFITAPLPPIYAIPTTAGTGSEVGRAGVIVCADTGVKTVIFHPDLLPRIAVLDPELTVGLPPHLTAATGMDAFTHGLEAYLAQGFHPMADAIALGCMELVVQHLPAAVARGEDLSERGHMLLAATMGATAFQKGLGIIHSMAHPLSTRYGIHHGLANALLMPPVLAWQLEAKAAAFTADLWSRHARVARLFGSARDPGDLPEAIAELCRRVGITDTLSDHGLRDDDIPALADEAAADGCHRTNPIPVTRDDFVAAFRRCL